MTKYVEWNEPFCFKESGPRTLNVVQRMLVSDVIEWQHWHGKQLGKNYKSDEDALDDFVVVHWATVINAD
jgi:hypothetical protein